MASQDRPHPGDGLGSGAPGTFAFLAEEMDSSPVFGVEQTYRVCAWEPSVKRQRPYSDVGPPN